MRIKQYVWTMKFYCIKQENKPGYFNWACGDHFATCAGERGFVEWNMSVNPQFSSGFFC